MKINNNSIRIREIRETSLKWQDHVDTAEDELTVPVFQKTAKLPYSGILKPSLDLLYFRRLCAERGKADGEKYIYTRGRVEYTDLFLLVNMDRTGRERESFDAASVYQHGIYQVDSPGLYDKYIEYKRSSSAAKKGKHIFIRQDFYDDMMRWTWLGFVPKSTSIRLPYAEMKAYETLVNSNIQGVIQIDPDEILLLDDIHHPFRTQIAKVVDNDGSLAVERCEDEVANNVFDGECLLDESVFAAAGLDSGMMLLRNFFFKSCGFRTDIQGYYKEHFGDAYEYKSLEDAVGNLIKVKNVKMIVTKSSFKLFKFKGYFCACEMSDPEKRGDGSKPEPPEAEDIDYWEEFDDTMFTEGSAYERWRRKVRESGSIFGIVKQEEQHRDKRKFTYQMLNSMNFSEDEVKELMSKDVDHLLRLMTDDNAYEKYLRYDEEEQERDVTNTDQLLLDFAKKNPAFRQTNLYKTKRNNLIKAHKRRLYEGRLTIEADYCTLCSMPMELLRYSVLPLLEPLPKPLLKKGEVYIAGRPDGEMLTLCRNPHTCPSNVVCATNRAVPELDRWFHFRRQNGFSNIIVLSPWEWDVMEALNGADFDSDEVLCIENPIVLKRALELKSNEQIAAVPHMCISSSAQEATATEDFQQQYVIDQALSGNKIGIISNDAQILNGYYWDSFHEGSRFAGQQEKIYEDLQILSVLMGIEIDKAKHAYTVDTVRTANQIMKRYATGKEPIDRPIYMCYIDKSRHKEGRKKAMQGQWLNCPLDYVAKRIFHLKDTEECLINKVKTPTIPLEKLFDVDNYKYSDGHKVESVLDKLTNCIQQMKRYNINKADLEWVENQELKDILLNDTYYFLAKNKISLQDMKRVLYFLLAKDPRERMKQPVLRDHFYECMSISNSEALNQILGVEEILPFHDLDILGDSTRYLEHTKAKDKKQISYTKCNQFFERFLALDHKNIEETRQFAQELKPEKNPLNVAYMLQIVSSEPKYPAAVHNKLISLALLYHIWPDLVLTCVKNAEN